MTLNTSPGRSASRQTVRWHPFATVSKLEEDAAHAIIHAALQAILRSGIFTIVLAGGTTPRQIYTRLRNMPADWQKWHVYFGDERCLAPDNPDRNSQMAASAWLDHVDIPANQIHVIPAELGADTAAKEYSQDLRNIGQFDLVLVGLGEDGHTASLFPDQDAGDQPESPSVLAVHDAPKPPLDRVSLSAQRLSHSRQVIFLVTGDSKKSAIDEWRSGQDIPAARICPENGVDVYIENKLLA
jgi:6-phosphogluconolactonase